MLLSYELLYHALPRRRKGPRKGPGVQGQGLCIIAFTPSPTLPRQGGESYPFPLDRGRLGWGCRSSHLLTNNEKTLGARPLKNRGPRFSALLSWRGARRFRRPIWFLLTRGRRLWLPRQLSPCSRVDGARNGEMPDVVELVQPHHIPPPFPPSRGIHPHIYRIEGQASCQGGRTGGRHRRV